MAKPKTVQAAASEDQPRKKPTWKQEQFIEEYIANGGNGTAAYHLTFGGNRKSAEVLSSRMLGRVEISEAIEQRREQIRKELRFSKEDALRVLIALATTTPDQVAKVLRQPYKRENYKDLGVKKVAIEVQKTPEGYYAKTPTAGERRAALNELWDKLGLGQESSGGNWFDGLEGLAGLVRAIKDRKQ